MERYSCKLCSKIFINGRALGGHMRSHLVILPILAKTQQQKLDGLTKSCSSLSCSEEEEEEEENREVAEKALVQGSRENRKRSFRVVDPKSLESDTESSENPNRRRAKRVRKMSFADKPKQRKHSSIELEPASLVFDEEEDLALCLMMLSRDTWSSSDSAAGEYRCETCNKIFRSFQALGGHRTSHVNESRTQRNQRSHKCPICFKVFSSGQALGGHKRSHFSSRPTFKFAETVKRGLFLIDLNLPAPLEEEEEDFGPEVSEVKDPEQNPTNPPTLTPIHSH